MLPTLFTDATIITVNENREIIRNGAILVQDNLIADIGQSELLKVRYAGSTQISLVDHIVIPGLISTHMHTAQTLIRGAADDLELVSWLCERIWVFQGNYTEEEAMASVEISVAEMLLTGTTCFLESMVSHLPPILIRASSS
jgi:cytosine/adenosine deaminase-related metal-dependent hydrolase